MILLALQVFPFAYTFWLSFSRLRRGEAQFVGMGNYLTLLDLPSFWESLRLSVGYSIAYVSLTLICALCLALLLSQRLRYVRVYLILLMIPWVISDVVAGTMWRWMFQAQYGIVTYWASFVGISVTLTTPRAAFWVVTLASVWQSVAFILLLLLGMLRSIPQELHEAAQIDGANAYQQLVHITLPLIRPAIFIAVILLSMRSINAAGLIYTTTSGGPGRATQTLAVYLLTLARGQGEFGLGAALAVLMLIINVLLVLGYAWVYRWMRTELA